jgi:hypothetical protein
VLFAVLLLAVALSGFVLLVREAPDLELQELEADAVAAAMAIEATKPKAIINLEICIFSSSVRESSQRLFQRLTIAKGVPGLKPSGGWKKLKI